MGNQSALRTGILMGDASLARATTMQYDVSSYQRPMTWYNDVG